ncbi:uncharacterized protein MICPUCDRAFT_40018 [Micromonas pusilla CCMP1545]|uniref:Predicted protein n=1 Tax=Micromonas pusilla (strain CCMP1545) TaxID=564608 RepID=C1MSG9_MICPC|nr:uncharacterized protein MICPUCDRAFT_40018 [Micromonas pusilla CCMP1545]EEH57506.1 predicted protein [Micromonas pusilla CCMP1545]|eukprot:XP_003059051.1 predicted protein [Micromonas pusilla CCMP1545]
MENNSSRVIRSSSSSSDPGATPSASSSASLARNRANARTACCNVAASPKTRSSSFARRHRVRPPFGFFDFFCSSLDSACTLVSSSAANRARFASEIPRDPPPATASRSFSFFTNDLSAARFFAMSRHPSFASSSHAS